jgi:hypothetical protein
MTHFEVKLRGHIAEPVAELLDVRLGQNTWHGPSSMARVAFRGRSFHLDGGKAVNIPL